MSSAFFSCSRWVCQSLLAALVLTPLAAIAEPLTPPQPAPAPDAEVPLTKQDAPGLVAESLAAQLVGETNKRDALLKQAVEADPDFAPARWQRGEIQFDGKWRSLEAIHDRVASNPRYYEYANLRAQMAGTLTDHEELARWCYREGLENEERVHWRRVLAFNPQHKFARDRLGVRTYRGGLYTKQQINEAERREADAEATFIKWKPKFVALCQQAVGQEGTARDEAFAELRNVADVRQIPALEDAVRREAKTASDAKALELYIAVVESLSKSEEPEATHRLLDYAIYAARPELRQLAAQKLKPRPVTDYVPQLMGALTAPVEAEIVGFASADGTVFVEEMYAQSGPLADFTSRRSQSLSVFQVGGARGRDGGPGPNTIRQAQNLHHRAAAQVAAARQNVAATNSQINSRNLRVREVLANVFEGDLGPDPRAYWQAWTDFNELYIPDRETISLADEVNYQYIPTMSCFAPGTLIWTQSGPRPIEIVAVGEMVLSQDPSTGELAFRPVVETTIRPPSKMMRIEAGGSEIDATLGHRLWVNGKGWEMAKFLAPQASVQSVNGAVEVGDVRLLPPEALTEAYNLVVEDFHTYFVGEAKLLVHDNTCPKPTASKTPGQASIKLESLATTSP